MNWSPAALNPMPRPRPRSFTSKSRPKNSRASSMSPTSRATWLNPTSVARDAMPLFYPPALNLSPRRALTAAGRTRPSPPGRLCHLSRATAALPAPPRPRPVGRAAPRPQALCRRRCPRRGARPPIVPQACARRRRRRARRWRASSASGAPLRAGVQPRESLRGHQDGVPLVGVAGRQREGAPRAVAADDDRRPAWPRGPGPQHGVAQPVELAVERDWGLIPQEQRDDLESLFEAGESELGFEQREAVSLVLALLPARADAEPQTPAGETVHGARHPGGDDRVPERDRRDERPELYAIGIVREPG